MSINPNEFAAAAREAAETAGNHQYTHKFAAPFCYEKQTYEELTFDWSKLTGRDSLAIENELLSLGKTVVIPSMSVDFLVRMAARACTTKIGADAIMTMPLYDFNCIRSKARNFLLTSE